MAFKPYNPHPSPEEQAASEAARRKVYDRSAFGEDVAAGKTSLDKATFHLLTPPVSDFPGHHMKARDKDGIVELLLKGDRGLDKDIHSDTWHAVATLLADQGPEHTNRAGLLVEASGRHGRIVGPNWKPGDASFRGVRAFAIEQAVVHLGDGRTIQVGRPMEPIAPRAAESRTVDTAAVSSPSPSPSTGADLAAQDARVFKGKPLRTIDLRLEHGAFQPDAQGDWTIGAANARGPVGLRLPADRAEAWQTAQAPTLQAFQEAQAAAKAANGGGLSIKATGAFTRHTVDNGGVAKEQWEFVATRFTFAHAGVTHQVGRDIVAPVAEQAPPAKPKAQERGQAR